MIQQFKTFIKEKKLFAPADEILLAVSGGLDSVVMSHLFKVAGFEFGIAHCNFKLRGDESDGDEKFVKELAKNYKVKLFVKDFETEKYALEKGISIQVAARDLRYSFFESVCAEHDFNYVATAHHADDFTETVLMNLVRGSGLAALHGIKAKNKNIIRPLLFASRDEIEAYAKENRLTWREDSSNLKDDYTRNKIRHHVIPLLKEINPSLAETILSNASHVEEAERVLQDYVNTSKKATIKEGDNYLEFDIKKLSQLSAPVTFLFELLNRYGFNSSICRDIFHSIQETETKIFYSDGWRAVKEREKLVVRKNIQLVKELFIVDGVGSHDFCKLNLRIEKVRDIDQVKQDVFNSMHTDNNSAFLDADKISFPLILRHWQEGDSFFPLGMKGKKLLSDYFIDEKFSMEEKQQQFLLLTDNTVLWVVGKRLAEYARLTPTTQNILQIKVSYNE